MKNIVLQKKLPLLFAIASLLLMSLLNMYGASFISDLYSQAFKKQCLWIVVSLIAAFAIYKVNMNVLLKYSSLFYWLGCLSLVLVLKFGANINGATSWFKIGGMSFQPSELFKVFYLLHIAKIIGNTKKHDIKLFIKILLLTFIPCFLIFLEPDTGVVVMYMLMMFGLIWSSKIEKKYPIILITSGVVASISFFGLYFLNGDLFTKIFGVSFFYRMDRLLSFKNVSSYQLTNALIGVGSSGLFGFGVTHKKMYIPEVTTDFVFDLTILNFGLIAGFVVSAIYAFILYSLYKSIKVTKNKIYKSILTGSLFMMIFQVFEHIFMNLGLTPITGITLPFLSYGGSSLLSYCLLFGVILKITTNKSSYN